MSHHRPMDYNTLLNEIAIKLPFLSDKPEETPESTLKALWLTAAGLPVSAEKSLQLALPTLTSEQEATLLQLLEQRKNNIPLGHLSGRQSFMGLELRVDQRALIPRKETELLGQKALEISRSIRNHPIHVMDVCCGAGNLALALASHNPACRVWCADLSPDAVALCQENIDSLQLQNVVNVRQSDLFSAFNQESFYNHYQLIVCNPPYILSSRVDKMNEEIAGNEPHLAFDGGMLGINIIRRLLNEAPRFLANNGWLAFELGAGQGPFILKLINKTGLYQTVQPFADNTGTIRAIGAQKASPINETQKQSLSDVDSLQH